jgi:hypothetical protein
MGTSIGGILRGIANTRGWNNAPVDSSGIGNAARMVALPQPHIAAPTLPAGSPNPLSSPSMNVEQQALMETAGGDRQPRADQVPSEKNLSDPKNPVNQENAVIDHMINICRGC